MAGVYYAATELEARMCSGSPVAVVPVQTTDGEETGCGCRVAGDANRGGGAPASVAVVATLLAFVRRRGRDDAQAGDMHKYEWKAWLCWAPCPQLRPMMARTTDRKSVV